MKLKWDETDYEPGILHSCSAHVMGGLIELYITQHRNSNDYFISIQGKYTYKFKQLYKDMESAKEALMNYYRELKELYKWDGEERYLKDKETKLR